MKFNVVDNQISPYQFLILQQQYVDKVSILVVLLWMIFSRIVMRMK